METPVKNRLSGSPDQPTSRKSFRIVVAVIAFILLAGAAAVQQVRGQDAAASAARILARGDDEAAARDAVARMAGDDASLSHTVEGGWVTVEVVQPGPGPLAWAEVLTLTAHAAAPDQRPGTPAAGPEDRS